MDNFIHISLVVLEEIFLDIEYKIEGTLDLRIMSGLGGLSYSNW